MPLISMLTNTRPLPTFVPSDHVVDLDDILRFGIVSRAGVADIDLLVVGREADAVGLVEVVGDEFDFAGLGIHAIHGLLQIHLALVAFVVAEDAVAGVGEPDAAVGMHHDVVGRIEVLAVVFLGDDGDAAVELVANHAVGVVLAGKLPALKSKVLPLL